MIVCWSSWHACNREDYLPVNFWHHQRRLTNVRRPAFNRIDFLQQGHSLATYRVTLIDSNAKGIHSGPAIDFYSKFLLHFERELPEASKVLFVRVSWRRVFLLVRWITRDMGRDWKISKRAKLICIHLRSSDFVCEKVCNIFSFWTLEFQYLRNQTFSLIKYFLSEISIDSAFISFLFTPPDGDWWCNISWDIPSSESKQHRSNLRIGERSEQLGGADKHYHAKRTKFVLRKW